MELLMERETRRLIDLLRSSLRMLGLSNRWIAQELGMSPSYLSKLFAGMSELRLDHVIRICQAARIEPAEFFRLAYPYPPADSSLAARRLREIMQSGGPPPKPAPRFSPEEVEEILKEVLERMEDRSRKTA
jgi:transcriptional regulator with XRE-family HTH domain